MCRRVMFTTIQILIVASFILMVNSDSSQGHRRVSYTSRNGTQCLLNEDCGGGIPCRDGFCACGLSNGMIFDKMKKSCAKTVGSNCSIPVENFPCVSNSICDEVTLKCTCDGDEFSSTSYGECRLNYGAECWRDRPSCNPEKFLRCNIDGYKCTCANDDEQIYSNRTGAVR